MAQMVILNFFCNNIDGLVDNFSIHPSFLKILNFLVNRHPILLPVIYKSSTSTKMQEFNP